MNTNTVVRFALRAYQVARGPHLPSCRFVPTCSAYALQAFEMHGTKKAMSLTAGRLLRCRPRGGWGADPVPLSDPAHLQSSSRPQ